MLDSVVGPVGYVGLDHGSKQAMRAAQPARPFLDWLVHFLKPTVGSS